MAQAARSSRTGVVGQPTTPVRGTATGSTQTMHRVVHDVSHDGTDDRGRVSGQSEFLHEFGSQVGGRYASADDDDGSGQVVHARLLSVGKLLRRTYHAPPTELG